MVISSGNLGGHTRPTPSPHTSTVLATPQLTDTDIIREKNLDVADQEEEIMGGTIAAPSSNSIRRRPKKAFSPIHWGSTPLQRLPLTLLFHKKMDFFLIINIFLTHYCANREK